MSRIVHFELPADDPERAAAFYRAVFGWRIDKWEGPMDYWLVTTGEPGEPGIDGALTRRSEGLTHTTNTVGVEDLDACLVRIEAAGGRIIMPKGPIPGIGWLAYALDSEGNIFGMMQADPSASG